MSYLFPMTLAEWRLLGGGVEPLVWGVDQTIVSEERKWIMSWRVELVLTKCKQAYHRFVFNSRQQLKTAKGFQFSFLKRADCWYNIYFLSPTEVKLPEVVQPASLHPSKDVEFRGTKATVGNRGVGFPRWGTTTLRLWDAPASCPWYWLQLQLIEVTHVSKMIKSQTRLCNYLLDRGYQLYSLHAG